MVYCVLISMKENRGMQDVLVPYTVILHYKKERN